MCHMQIKRALEIWLEIEKASVEELQEAHGALDSLCDEVSAGVIARMANVPPSVDLSKLKKIRLKLAGELAQRGVGHKLPRPARRPTNSLEAKNTSVLIHETQGVSEPT